MIEIWLNFDWILIDLMIDGTNHFKFYMLQVTTLIGQSTFVQVF